MNYRRTCKICLAVFETKNSKKTCCSNQCAHRSIALNNKRLAEERKALRDKTPHNPCELCAIVPDKKYASGRFCSSKCSRSFSTSKNRDEISKKASETLRNHQEELVNSTDIPPCSICGIRPHARHKTGLFCLDCAYKATSHANIKKLVLKRNKRVMEKCRPEKCDPWTSEARKTWEAGDKSKECEGCGSLFQITWKNRHRKYCSDNCIRFSHSSKMIQRNIDGDFFQSFGHRVNYEEEGLDIRCDSLIEWCFLEDFVKSHKGLMLSIARSSLRIPYDIDGRSRTYTPDFDVTLKDGKKYVVECKSEQSGTSEIWIRYHNEANLKRKLLESYCAEQGLTFIWFTQKTRKDLYRKAQKLFKH